MPQMIFVNLPVADVARARGFYQALGFTINESMSNADGACVVVSDTIMLMVLAMPFFQGFSALPVADTKATTSVLIALNREDRAGVDAMIEAALAHGGTTPRPALDHGFMYQRTFADPDGNMFEPFWMDAAAMGG